MSEELIKRMRKNRELKVTVGKFSFIARRPTDVEALELHRNGGAFTEIAQRFVIGWDGVTENDVAGGGSNTTVPFTAPLWAEWCADRPDFWAPIANSILDAYKLHAEQMDDAAKN